VNSIDMVVTEQNDRFVDVDLLKRGRWQPRRHFDETKLQELADSIEQVGIIEPIITRFDKLDGLFEIIAGERRWRASQLAMVYQVPVIVRNDLTDDQARSMALIENLQREDLNPIEEAEGIKALIDQLHITHQEAGKRTGKSRSYITNSLRLLELHPTIQNYLRAGDLDAGHGKHLVTLSVRLQLDLARMAVRHGWSVRKVGKRAVELKVLLSKEGLCVERENSDINRVESIISERYSMPTKLDFDQKKSRGTLTFEWNSIDELHGLLNAWGLSEKTQG
jgi:ParB family transcriptional regulator, chromosome partitioning protein